MLRIISTVYIAFAALCSACVEAWSMTQPLQGRFPSTDWVYWHVIVFALSVVLLGLSAALIHVRKRWWAVMAALVPLIIAGISLHKLSFTVRLNARFDFVAQLVSNERDPGAFYRMFVSMNFSDHCRTDS